MGSNSVEPTETEIDSNIEGWTVKKIKGREAHTERERARNELVASSLAIGALTKQTKFNSIRFNSIQLICNLI